MHARLQTSPARGVHSGVPTFFRGCCYEASRGGPHNSYAAAAWHLTNALGSQQPHDVELDDWIEEVEKLEELVIADDDDGVWRWFRDHYPRCMALVPTRRRNQFVAGVKQAREDGRLCA